MRRFWHYPLVRPPTLLALALVLLGCGEPRPPDRIFLITIDTLRADHLGLYGYIRATSPFLDSLGEKGLVVETAFASSSHTAPSHASLFTSLHPAQHRLSRNGEELHASLLTLARIFGDRGYRTAAFTPIGFLEGVRSGFDDFHSEGSYVPAEKVLGRARDWILDQPKEARIFLWIHLYDVHQWDQGPFVDAEALREIKSRGVPPDDDAFAEYLEREHGAEFLQGRERILRAVDQYDAQIRSVDRRLATFFEEIRGAGLAADALWIVTSDHGEGLGNHNYLKHAKHIYREQVHVPLLFYFSDRRYPPRRVPGLVQLVDVGPTLAELIGGSFADQVIAPAGRSLLPLFANPEASSRTRAVFAQRPAPDESRQALGWRPGATFGFRTESFSVIGHTGGQHEIYDLGEDPFELHNKFANLPPEKERFLESLLEQYRVMSEEGERLGSGEINPEYLEELRALGYL